MFFRIRSCVISMIARFMRSRWIESFSFPYTSVELCFYFVFQSKVRQLLLYDIDCLAWLMSGEVNFRVHHTPESIGERQDEQDQSCTNGMKEPLGTDWCNARKDQPSAHPIGQRKPSKQLESAEKR